MATLTDTNSTIRQTILGLAGSSTAAIGRIPFVFSSLYRLYRSGNANIGVPPKDMSLADIEAQVANAGNTTAPATDPVNVAGVRVQATISLMVNPHSIQWSQPKRFSKEDVKRGSIFYHFTDKNGRNDDIAVLTFQGRTGNINYKADDDTGAGQPTGNTQKLLLWHELYALTHEPPYIPGFGRNDMCITYSSNLFPTQDNRITLWGFFNSVLQFTEDANDPFNRNYSFAFTVTNTNPPLYSIVQSVNTKLTTKDQSSNT